jgi:hypothetical protein
MTLIDTISTSTSVPLLSTIIQLFYDYNVVTYKIIKIHIHQLFISSSYVFHFE